VPATSAGTMPDGRRRVAIEAVSPEIDAGRFPAKRAVGESVTVEADIFADGHDSLAAVLRYRHRSSGAWFETPMAPLANDRWRGEFVVTELGRYVFTLEAWVDHFETWRRQFAKRVEAGQDVSTELEVAARMVEAAAARADGDAGDAERLRALAAALRQSPAPASASLDGDLGKLMGRYADRSLGTGYGRELEVIVEPEKARFSAWYELFPRSAGDPGRHGTFRDAERQLPRIAEMGFDVLYLPPIHPIGKTHRKGANNKPAQPGEPGSPWAIGSDEGGHKAINPALGTLEDFHRLLAAAAAKHIDVALDVAFQCSPDHPYTREHPEWFMHRPDGSIQYAENPPKKYEDIFPFDFEIEHWRELWQELLSIVVYWIDQGVHVFRVDNPHTKPFVFWEWLIGEVKREHPDVIFLAEAFTRPKVMYRLAKVGFSQSYTYFAWRNTAWELYQYFTELSQPPIRQFFRPNLWPNTPDILTEYLQHGGRTAFMTRLVLAATLGASYGIYGPAFELCENRAREQGSEEYLDSEKYELRPRDYARALAEGRSLEPLIKQLNMIRRLHPALQQLRTIHFHGVDNDALLAYSKFDPATGDCVLVVVTLNAFGPEEATLWLDMAALGMEPYERFWVRDEITGQEFQWGQSNYIRLDPARAVAHIINMPLIPYESRITLLRRR
jgi:starch synthase (maltosyl-transferring)